MAPRQPADLTEFEETHSHDVKTQPLVIGLAVVVAVLAAAVVILGLHITHRQALADSRQALANTRQAANVAAQNRLNTSFEATREAQCYLIAYSASHVEQPHRSVIREALANAAVRAGCVQIVYQATHPTAPVTTPPATATVTVPGPTTTVTVTKTPAPPARHHRKPTAKPTPLCTIGPVTAGRLPCPPTIRPSLAPNLS